MVKTLTVVAVALAPSLLLFVWPGTALASGAMLWATVCLCVAGMCRASAEKPRRIASQQRFGHDNASWDSIWQFDNEEQRRKASQARFGHPNASLEDSRQFDLELKRRQESQARFAHENASWDDICQHDRDRPRREESQKYFGHPSATVDEIRHFVHEQRRKAKSQKRFGHPNATWQEIQRHDRKRSGSGSSLGTSINGAPGLKLGGSLVIEFGTGNIAVRRS